jgi:tetratricopeptide (TPR) repeat protein
MSRWIALSLLLLALPAFAADLPAQSRQAELDTALRALAGAPGEQAAAMLETRIRQLWVAEGSPACVLLMSRGERELQAGAADEAEADFTAALALDPDYAEAYARRAVARQQQGNAAGAIADIGEALKREPRHFEALQDLSRIAEARGDWLGALAAWRKALELDPKTPGGKERLNMLRLKAEGEATCPGGAGPRAGGRAWARWPRPAAVGLLPSDATAAPAGRAGGRGRARGPACRRAGTER